MFLAVAAALSALTRGELPAGLFGMRLVALAGVALMAAALPRLARHSGADPSAALWLGALNPLVLLHLVAGAHNDAVMLGLLGVGLVAALGRWPVLGAVPSRSPPWSRRPPCSASPSSSSSRSARAAVRRRPS
ncbi:Alpha-(1-_6)-mannopyranosyltransferase [Streptomyces purpurascens]